MEIIAIDSDANAAGLYLADKGEVAPRVSDPALQDFVLTICNKYRVNMIIPTYSVELPFYASNQRELEALGIKTMVSPNEKLELCDDKLKIAAFFDKFGIKHPKLYRQIDIANLSRDEFPLFIKSRFGSGSSHARRLDDP